MQPKVLEDLPVVSIHTKLPSLEDRSIIWPVNSPWQKAEREVVLGIVTTHAIREGGWQPVTSAAFGGILQESPWMHMNEGVFNAMWEMAEEGLLEIVEVQEAQYLIPTNEFTQILAQCSLRSVPPIRT